jgi:hypothetical protein
MKGVSALAVAFVGGLIVGGLCTLITLLVRLSTW